jgi:serine/threonine protein kinase
MFFGYVFGPVVGFATGFLGGIPLILGEPWSSIDIALGLEGLLMGLAALILPERKSGASTGLPWCALLAVISSFASASFAFLIDKIIGHGFPPELYALMGVDDAINGAIFTPLITFIYYRIRHALAIEEATGKRALEETLGAELLMAVENRDVVKVRDLLKKGASVNARDSKGATPLHKAAYRGDLTITQLLIKHGADVNARENMFGETPLHCAARSHALEVVELLLQHGADPSIRNINGQTPLELAQGSGYEEIARVIEEFVRAGSLTILGVEYGELFLDEWGKIIVRVRGVGRASLSVEGDIEWVDPGFIELSGESIIEVPVKPKSSGEVPIKVILESYGKKEIKLFSLKIGIKIESVVKLLVGQPVRLSLPSSSATRLDRLVKLGWLECRDFLNVGGFSTVVICVDEAGVNYAVKMPTQVFVKILASGAPTSMDIDLKPFKKEVDVLKNITDHPCIVGFHGSLDSPPALIFELCKCSLRDVLKVHRRLEPLKASEILIQVSDALAYLHSKGYVHGDVKPENILFSIDGVPKLSDFNTAKALSTVSKSAPGYTPGYAAPEQLRGAEKLTVKTDSWALGLILYETITGKPLLPMDELEYRNAVAKLEKGELAVESTGVKEIDEIVKSCLKVNPEERPSAIQIRDALARYLVQNTRPETQVAPSVETMAPTALLQAADTLISITRLPREFGRADFVNVTPREMIKAISRRHFMIGYDYSQGTFYIQDLGSTNGTYVNGVDIRGKGLVPLKNGDRINVAGVLDLTFVSSLSPRANRYRVL